MGYKAFLEIGIKLQSIFIFLIVIFLVSFFATLAYKLYKRQLRNNNEYINLDKSNV